MILFNINKWNMNHLISMNGFIMNGNESEQLYFHNEQLKLKIFNEWKNTICYNPINSVGVISKEDLYVINKINIIERI